MTQLKHEENAVRCVKRLHQIRKNHLLRDLTQPDGQHLSFSSLTTSPPRPSSQSPSVSWLKVWRPAPVLPTSPELTLRGSFVPCLCVSFQPFPSEYIRAGPRPLKPGWNTYAAPLLSVEQAPTCADANSSSPECFITALMVQIPFEIVPMQPGQVAAQLPGNGTASKAFNLFPLVDNLHVITGCDKQPNVWLNVTGFRSSNPFPTAPCNAVATHADGSLVSADSPAKPGEVVVIYAFGLGKTSPPVKTGEATPTPAPVLSRDFLLGGINPYPALAIQLDFRPNAGPSRPFVTPLIMVPAAPGPAFMGLTPGQVGL